MRSLLRAATLLVLSASTLTAQDSWTGTFAPGTSPVYQYGYNGLGVGAYRGTLTADGSPMPTPVNGGFDFWCVDANGLFSGGSVTVHRISSLHGPLRDALAQAAYLTTLRSSHTTAWEMSNLHAAIWYVTGGLPGTWTPQSTTAMQALVAQAQANYRSVNLDNFYYVAFAGSPSSQQELIFQGAGAPFDVPEPSSLALLGVGGVLVGWSRRRRKR